MALSVVMPALEMAQETGKVVAWKKQEGELVKKGELLLEIETDKAVVEIEAAADGTLAGITAREGAVVPVGQTIAWLLSAGESIPQASSPVQTGRRTDAAPSRAAAATPTAPPPAQGIRISPKARRLAEQHGIDLSTIRGSGLGGEILADDILAASTQAGAAKNASTSSAPGLSTIARLMAERTTQSWTSVPHIFLTRDVDATSLNAARTRLVPAIEKSHGVKLTHTDLLVVLVAQTLRAHPAMNASWVDGGIRNNADVHVGVAMAVSDGVVAPVIRNAARYTPRRRRGAAARSRRSSAHRQAAASGSLRRDLHDQQSRHVPGGRLHRHHRAAAGRDSRDWRHSRSGGRGEWPACSPSDAERHTLRRSSRGGRREGRSVPQGSCRRGARCRPSPSRVVTPARRYSSGCPARSGKARISSAAARKNAEVLASARPMPTLGIPASAPITNGASAPARRPAL